MQLLIVDDDEAVRASLAHALARDGYRVSHAADGHSALRMASEEHFSAIVLDVMMPEPNGLEVCRILRGRGVDSPVLMLTARDLVSDRVAGLDAGADDYLSKPFALEELRARLRALLRRTGQNHETLTYAGLELDLAECRARRGERTVTLTRTEFAMLELFLRNPRRVLSRAVIFDAVWGYDFGPGSNALWVYISYLRAKLEADGEPRLIQTVRGLGYVLREEA